MMDYSMNTAPLTVTQTVTLELIDPTGAVTPIDAERHYDPRDPYAVTAVFMTGTGHVPTVVEAMKGGALDLLSKPFTADALCAAIARATA